MKDRPTRILAIAVGLIVLVALIAGVLSSRTSSTVFDRATPQGVVQAYLAAVLKGDNATAAGYFAPTSLCSATDLDQISAPVEARIVLLDTSTTDSTAVVSVKVTRGANDGPLDSTEYAEDVTYRLTRVDGQWRLSGIPWPLYGCGEGKPL